MSEDRSTTVCIAGGGPAGIILGLLLSRAGIDVTVLEKHDDFFRDFRGDTIHPSTLDLLGQLDLLDALTRIEHTQLRTLDVVVRGVRVTPVDFGLLRHGANRLAFLPQGELLDLLASSAAASPRFHLLMGTEATGLVEKAGEVRGVDARTRDGRALRILADLTIAADGRSSTLREASGSKVIDKGAPIDVLWFRLPRPVDNPPETFGNITRTSMVITIPRPDYYQTAFLIAKGANDEVRAGGIERFRESIADAVPFLRPSVGAVTSWDDVQLLSVQINRMATWHRPGFLAIGDAAHAMSPAFGVGINYAIQDAVATANLLVGPLRAGSLSDSDLAKVQRRREPPVRAMQALQRRMHAVIGRPGAGATLPPGLVIRAVMLVAGPAIRPLLALIVGRGFRRERIAAAVLDPSGSPHC